MISDAFDYSVGELKQGCQKTDAGYRCLFCDREYLKGDIYSFDGRLVEAKTAIRLHITEDHGCVFDMLGELGKKSTGLTDAQMQMLRCFYKGLSDKETAALTGTVPATVRFQRFSLREKARRAKVFLSLYELSAERDAGQSALPPHAGATMIDERYSITGEEKRKIAETFFSSFSPLRLKTFSSKEKKKLVILSVIAEQFDKGRKYSEQEINSFLKSVYGDYATLRRYLIEYGFMERTKNCKEYWLKEPAES